MFLSQNAGKEAAQPSKPKTQSKKAPPQKELQPEIKQRRLMSLEEKHFVAAARKWKMLAATKAKMSGSEEKIEHEHLQHFLHKTCN